MSLLIFHHHDYNNRKRTEEYEVGICTTNKRIFASLKFLKNSPKLFGFHRVARETRFRFYLTSFYVENLFANSLCFFVLLVVLLLRCCTRN